jgi:hypothetical protein
MNGPYRRCLHEAGTKSNRDHFVSRPIHSIIYNRCSHETGTKITQAGLKACCLLDRARLTSDRVVTKTWNDPGTTSHNDPQQSNNNPQGDTINEATVIPQRSTNKNLYYLTCKIATDGHFGIVVAGCGIVVTRSLWIVVARSMF